MFDYFYRFPYLGSIFWLMFYIRYNWLIDKLLCMGLIGFWCSYIKKSNIKHGNSRFRFNIIRNGISAQNGVLCLPASCNSCCFIISEQGGRRGRRGRRGHLRPRSYHTSSALFTEIFTTDTTLSIHSEHCNVSTYTLQLFVSLGTCCRRSHFYHI